MIEPTTITLSDFLQIIFLFLFVVYVSVRYEKWWNKRSPDNIKNRYKYIYELLTPSRVIISLVLIYLLYIFFTITQHYSFMLF